MRYDFNEQDFGLALEGWAQVNDDGTIADFQLIPPPGMPEYLSAPMEAAFEKALPDMIDARQKAEPDEQDDAQYHYHVDEPARRRF